MRLTCPNNSEHKTFTMTAMVPETWLLNEDGDCEDAWNDADTAIDYDFKNALCQDCLVDDSLEVFVIIKEE